MSKKKNLTIEDYKESLLDDEDEIIDENQDQDIKSSKKIKEDKLSDDTFDDKNSSKKYNKIKLMLNIIFIVIVVLILMITTDIVCVEKYNKGPYFAINTKTYKDGGTKEYYGLGYKVIKYNQIEGRRGMYLGLWNLKYDTEPFEIPALDLAIEFTNKPQNSYKKYYKKYLKVTGTLISKDEENSILTFGYIDAAKKYNLDITCKMAENTTFSDIEDNSEITIVGTVKDFTPKSSDTNKTLYMNDCFLK